MTRTATDRLVDSHLRQDAADIFDARQERVQELITKYAGRLPSTAARTSTPTSLASVDALMAEWNPIGYNVESVELVLGPPSESSPEKFVYRYDTGRGGASWHFVRTRDIVTGIIHFMGQ
ncbi:MAG: hypothetical protein IT437_10880 [Phycisphaerales bacterium]|nr:hypothetical protein [Phycisphaerales bacterium]